MKSKKISIRLTAEEVDQIENRCKNFGINKTEYIKRCLTQTVNPVNCKAIARGLCNINTALNHFELEIQENGQLNVIRSEVNCIWQFLK